MENNKIITNQTNTVISNNPIPNNQLSEKKRDYLKLNHLIPNIPLPSTASLSPPLSLRIQVQQKKQLPKLESLLKKRYSSEQMKEFTTSLLEGPTPFNPFNALGEFLIMHMYNLITKLESNLQSDKSENNKKNSELKENCQKKLQTSKNSLLLMFNFIKTITSNPLEENFSQLTKKFDDAWSQLQKDSVEFLHSLNHLDCLSGNLMEKYIKSLNFLHTIYETIENRSLYFPRLYLPLKENINFFALKNIPQLLKQIDHSIQFTLNALLQYIHELKNISSAIDNKLQNDPKYNQEKFIYFKELIEYLEKRYDSIKIATAEFTLKGDFAKQFSSLSTHSTCPYLGFFNAQLIEETRVQCLKNWNPKREKFFELLLFPKKDRTLVEKFNKSQLEFKEKSFLLTLLQEECKQIVNLYNNFDLWNSHPTHILLTITAFFKHMLFELNAIKQSNVLMQHLSSENEVIFNNAYTLLMPLRAQINSLRRKTENAPALVVAEGSLLCFIVASALIPEASQENIALFLKNQQKLLPKVNYQLTQALSLIKETKNQDNLILLQSIQKQIQSYIHFFNNFPQHAALFFIQQRKREELTPKESQALSSFLLPSLNKKLQNSFLKQFAPFLQKELNQMLLVEENPISSSLRQFLQLHLNYFLKIESLMQKLCTHLVVQDNTTLTLTETSLPLVEKTLRHLQLLKTKSPHANDFIEDHQFLLYLTEKQKQLYLTLKKYQNQEKLHFDFFFFITLPILSSWFQKAKQDFNKIKKLQRKEKSNQTSISLKIINNTPNNTTSLSNTFPPTKDNSLKKVKIHLKQKSNSTQEKITENFITVHHPKKKKKPIKKLSPWEERTHKVEHLLEQLSIFNLSSDQESPFNLFRRCQKFQENIYHIFFHSKLIEDVSSIEAEKIPKISERITSQRYPLITECILKSILYTYPTPSQDNPSQHLLWGTDHHEFSLMSSHNGKKLYAYIDPKTPKENYPQTILLMREQLTHSYIGNIPSSVPFTDPISLANSNNLLLQQAINAQKTSKEKPISKQQLENIHESPNNSINRELFILDLPKKHLLLTKEYAQLKERILSLLQEKNIVQERIAYAFELADELFENNKIKESCPTLYTTLLADITNILMTNALHLLLERKQNLDKNLEKRPLKYCHNPLQIWQWLLEQKLVKENKKLTQCIQRCNSDSRYPYTKNSLKEQELVELFEIEISSSSAGESSIMGKLKEKHRDKTEEDVQLLIHLGEEDLYNCLEGVVTILNL